MLQKWLQQFFNYFFSVAFNDVRHRLLRVSKLDAQQQQQQQQQSFVVSTTTTTTTIRVKFNGFWWRLRIKNMRGRFCILISRCKLMCDVNKSQPHVNLKIILSHITWKNSDVIFNPLSLKGHIFIGQFCIRMSGGGAITWLLFIKAMVSYSFPYRLNSNCHLK